MTPLQTLRILFSACRLKMRVIQVRTIAKVLCSRRTLLVNQRRLAPIMTASTTIDLQASPLARTTRAVCSTLHLHCLSRPFPRLRLHFCARTHPGAVVARGMRAPALRPLHQAVVVVVVLVAVAVVSAAVLLGLSVALVEVCHWDSIAKKVLLGMRRVLSEIVIGGALFHPRLLLSLQLYPLSLRHLPPLHPHHY